MTGHHARFGGIGWCADLPLDQFDAAPPADIEIRVAQAPAILDRPILRHVGRAAIASDGVRFDLGDEGALDMVAGQHIGWVPGPAWTGRLPVAFYSSMAAITLAWRGLLPLHASTVVLGGRAWVLAGPAGSGKSTLAAELLEGGAQMLADDLTIFGADQGHAPIARAGRPALRLHPASAERVAGDHTPAPGGDRRGKVLVRPLARAADRGWPIGGVLLLGGPADAPLPAAEAAAAFGAMLFRPRIVGALPNRARLRAGLLVLARVVPVTPLPQVAGFGPAARSLRLAEVLQAIDRMADHTPAWSGAGDGAGEVVAD